MAVEPEVFHLMHARFAEGEEYGLFRSRDRADRACAQRKAPGVLAEVISLQVVGDTPAPGGRER